MIALPKEGDPWVKERGVSRKRNRMRTFPFKASPTPPAEAGGVLMGDHDISWEPTQARAQPFHQGVSKLWQS